MAATKTLQILKVSAVVSLETPEGQLSFQMACSRGAKTLDDAARQLGERFRTIAELALGASFADRSDEVAELQAQIATLKAPTVRAPEPVAAPVEVKVKRVAKSKS